jgi:tagaturonate reductase
VADGVLAAEFLWQEDLNKVPGLNNMVKQDLDLIQSVGMLEAVKSIL